MTRTRLRKIIAVTLILIAGIDIDRFLIGQTDSLFGMQWTVLVIAVCSLWSGLWLLNQKGDGGTVLSGDKS